METLDVDLSFLVKLNYNVETRSPYKQSRTLKYKPVVEKIQTEDRHDCVFRRFGTYKILQRKSGSLYQYY